MFAPSHSSSRRHHTAVPRCPAVRVHVFHVFHLSREVLVSSFSEEGADT